MRKWFTQQKYSLFFFSVLFAAIGMGIYFSLSFEPGLLSLCIILCCGISGLLCARKYKILYPCIWMLVGFGYAGIYTHTKDIPQLNHATHNIEITGTVSNIDYTPDKTRITLQTEKFGTVRVSTQDNTKVFTGDIITGRGGLFQPAPAPMPETFDMARWAFFNNISGTGYISDLAIIKPHTTTNASTFRQKIHNRTQSFLTDALILGYKNTLKKSDREIWNKNGVSHIWSISGYHMALIAGWLFAIFYVCFRCIPPITRRIPARIPALICAWFGLIGYMFLSGAGAATFRAFIMTTLVMIAFIMARNVFSLRTATMAFLLMIIINPYYVMQAGFQLSFAAIFGIIWLWSVAKPNMPSGKILKYLYTAFLTALVAFVFTAPFIIAHFNSIPIYGIFANIIIVPIFSVIIMPMVIIGTCFAMFGIPYILKAAHNIYDIIIKYAEHVSDLPLANINTINMPNTALILVIIGLGAMIFLRPDNKIKNIFIRHANITIASVFICLGLIVWSTTQTPIFYLSTDHNLIASRQGGKLYFNKKSDSGNYFAFNTWLQSNGESGESEHLKLKSDHGVYKISTPKWTLVYIQRFVPLAKNLESLCTDKNIKYIASYYDIQSQHCDTKILRGGGVIYKSGYFNKTPSNRLWHNRPE